MTDKQSGHQGLADKQSGHQGLADKQSGHQGLADKQSGHQGLADRVDMKVWLTNRVDIKDWPTNRVDITTYHCSLAGHVLRSSMNCPGKERLDPRDFTHPKEIGMGNGSDPSFIPRGRNRSVFSKDSIETV